MARDGAGNYSLPGTAFVAGTTAVAADVNAKFDDVASALSASLAKDGQTSPTADLPMANFKHTSVANAAARTQYASAAQVQDGAVVWGGTTGGTSTAYTGTVSPGGVALVSGLTVRAKLHATCGANPTFALNGLTAKAISYFSTIQAAYAGPRAGQLLAGQIVELTYESVQDKWFITSPLADPFAWFAASESVSGTVQATVAFTIPTGAARVRFEFADCAPSATQEFFMRFSLDGGATYVSGASSYVYTLNGAAAVTSSIIALRGFSVSESVQGFLEMQTNLRGIGYGTTNGIVDVAGTPTWKQTQVMFGFNSSGADITNVIFGFVGVNVLTHRIRMLAQRN